MISKFIPLNRHSAVHPNFLCYLVFKLPRYHKKELRAIHLVKQLFYYTHAQSGTIDTRSLRNVSTVNFGLPLRGTFRSINLVVLHKLEDVSTTVAQSSSRSPSVCAALQTMIKCKIPFLLAREGNAVEFGLVF